MGQKLSKLVNVYKKYGFCGFCRKLYAYVKANYFDKVSFVTFLRQRRIRVQLRELLAGDYDRIVLWRSSFGYNVSSSVRSTLRGIWRGSAASCSMRSRP